MSKHQKIVHKYIEQNPISKDSKALILGTIYPCACNSADEDERKDPTYYFYTDFFYGKKYSLWESLRTKFSLDISSLNELESAYKKNENDVEIFDESAQKIKKMLNKYGIAISDTVAVAQRKGDVCSADNFDEGTEYNIKLAEQIKNSSIETIYFTSVDTAKIFEKEIIKDKLFASNELFSGNVIEISLFERKIECVILPSPSSRSTSSNLYEQENKGESYAEWRLNYYKKAFSKYLRNN